MGPLQIQKGLDAQGKPGAWVRFDYDHEPVFIAARQWIGVDFDGTLARDDAAGHFDPPYPLGQAIPEMVAMIRSLMDAGVTVKIFSARACEPENIPVIQAWTERHGLGRMEVTNLKDYDLIRFFDDRAIQMLPNAGRSIGGQLTRASGVLS
jgi:hypothetical protein